MFGLYLEGAGSAGLLWVPIAAIAHVSRLVLVTINTRDFSRFTDLKVENWSKRRARR